MFIELNYSGRNMKVYIKADLIYKIEQDETDGKTLVYFTNPEGKPESMFVDESAGQVIGRILRLKDSMVGFLEHIRKEGKV